MDYFGDIILTLPHAWSWQLIIWISYKLYNFEDHIKIQSEISVLKKDDMDLYIFKKVKYLMSTWICIIPKVKVIALLYHWQIKHTVFKVTGYSEQTVQWIIRL